MPKNLGGSNPMLRARKASISITSATHEYLPKLLSMIRGFAEYEEVDHLMTATSVSLREVLFDSKASAEALLAFYEEECAGFAMFHSTYCGVRGRKGMFLSSLYVEPEFRDKGIGIALLKRVAAIASERGYHEAEWNVRSWNDSAISFFRAAGAEFPKGSTRFLMDEDALYCLARRGTEPTDDARPKHQAGGDEFSLKQGGRDENGHEQIRRTA